MASALSAATVTDGLHRLTLREMADGIAAGAFTSEALVRACLDRVAEREGDVRAFAAIDPERAIAAARLCDRAAPQGPLHGVPLGVKDVIDTHDLPTGMGSPLYEGYRPRVDAACVALVRAAGAVVLGKTATAEFAGSAPTVTRNPLDLSRTPGGSSSGSAAAVADFMVPAAFGTQTGGSVLRPASFCGVIGFKPTFGSYNPVGMKPAAESFDTIGLIARSLDDVGILHAVLTNDPDGPPAAPQTAPRIGLCRTYLWDTAGPETVAAVENAVNALREAGVEVRDVDMPASLSRLTEERAVVNAYERAQGLAAEWATGREHFSPQLTRTCEEGFRHTRADYVAAQRFLIQCRQAVGGFFEDVDLLLAPCVAGEAPEGIGHTGDPRLQEIWTSLHVPTLSLPTHRGPSGMPVGIQLIAPVFEEKRLLGHAGWIMARLGRTRP